MGIFDFQTPIEVCQYMVSLMPDHCCGTILEPTPGVGNLVNVLKSKGTVVAPKEFFDLDKNEKFSYIVGNPPFAGNEGGMVLGYKILDQCMEMSDNLIMLMPWLTIINSEKRTKKIMDFGLKSITHLPRNVFPGARVQTCILNMSKGYKGETVFNTYKLKTMLKIKEYES